MYQLMVKENIEDLIYKIEDKYVMLDSDLAKLFNIETYRMNEIVKRNSHKFSNNDYFRVLNNEIDTLISQNAISKRGGSRKGHTVFTLEGVLILSTTIRKKDTYKIVEEIKNAFNKKNYETEEYKEIQGKIYEIRGVQVMLDYDLAELYHCETGSINRARKRNINRFPETFSFQLTKEEYIDLKCQSGISKLDLRQINRSLPYVYTEQGVAMLSSVLHTDTAISVSIDIMNAFVAMRRYISNELSSVNVINSKLLEHDTRLSLLEETFDKFKENEKVNSIFFEGQIFDAYNLLMDILSKAKEEIIIIDNYAGRKLLKLLKDINVDIKIITANIESEDICKYNKQYKNITFYNNNSFHDRFIIIDSEKLYTSGSSFKDLGNKCFCLSEIADISILEYLLIELSSFIDYK